MNDYVATAAAEKRLREVLTARIGNLSDGTPLFEGLSTVLLEEAKIEYKARARQVTITLDLPEKAEGKPKMAEPDPLDMARDETRWSDPDMAVSDESYSPTPHVVPFVPKAFEEPGYEDIHFD